MFQYVAISFFLTAFGADASMVSRTCPPHMHQLHDNVCKLVIPYDMRSFASSNALSSQLIASSQKEFRANQIELGRKLFFDKRLSQDQKLSCASCHDPRLMMTDGKATALGVNGVVLSRNTPSLWNLIYRNRLFWDGRAQDLQDQLRQVVTNPKEMASSPDLIVARLSKSITDRAMFREVYGNSEINWMNISESIVAFEKSLVSFNSRYDQYALGDHSALDVTELKGFNVFRSFLARCSECHTPPLFTNQQEAVLGLRGVDNQSGSFLVPSLRNIATTAPYMHDGRFLNLDEVIRFYNKGGGRNDWVVRQQGQLVHWHIRPIGLSESEMRALERFLGALTDTTALPSLN